MSGDAKQKWVVMRGIGPSDQTPLCVFDEEEAARKIARKRNQQAKRRANADGFFYVKAQNAG